VYWSLISGHPITDKHTARCNNNHAIYISSHTCNIISQRKLTSNLIRFTNSDTGFRRHFVTFCSVDHNYNDEILGGKILVMYTKTLECKILLCLINCAIKHCAMKFSYFSTKPRLQATDHDLSTRILKTSQISTAFAPLYRGNSVFKI
jgi:hypothetical protein